MGLENTQVISGIRIDPGDSNLLYVAALGHPHGHSEDRGVFRSKDGGKTWQRILYRDEQAGAIDLALDPHDSKVLFASLWDVYRRPWMLSSGGLGGGLFKSTDGGDTWTDITRSPAKLLAFLLHDFNFFFLHFLVRRLRPTNRFSLRTGRFLACQAH
jgi:hypothetical protein